METKKYNMIIGITGRKGSGKSLAADYISQKYNYKIEAFATPIKQIAEIFGFQKEELYGGQSSKERVNERLGISARHFMQRFGTEIGRELLCNITGLNCGEHKNPWIFIMEQKINNRIVINDLRFVDEARMIKRNGGIIIRIIREDGNDNHKSEMEINKIIPDIVIFNSGKKKELFNAIDKYLSRII